MRTVTPDRTAVHDPHWTGALTEHAIGVHRGQPPRSDLHMQQAVHAQTIRYLDHHADRDYTEFTVIMAVQLIAADHIDPADRTGDVLLTREHLLEYLHRAHTRLHERATIEPAPNSGW